MNPQSPIHPAAPPPLYIVYNRRSGAGDGDAARSAIDAACAAAGRVRHLLAVEDPRRLAAVARDAVRQAAASGGIVVAAGGDGTINTVVQAALAGGVPMGVLPQGTFNYFGRTHGIPEEVEPALEVLLHGTAQPVQIGLVNDHVILVNASVGLYPQVLQDREGWNRRLGRSRLVALFAALQTLRLPVREMGLRLQVGEQSRLLRTSTLFVGNNALQLEQLRFPEADVVDHGALGLIVLRPVGRLELLGLLARGALGTLADADAVLHFSAAALTVDAVRTFGRRRVKVAIDGEVLRFRLPLTFSVAPRPLLLVKPLRAEARAAVDDDLPATPQAAGGPRAPGAGVEGGVAAAGAPL